jgi:hypothetical protein
MLGIINYWTLWDGASRAVPFTTITGLRMDKNDTIDIFNFIKTGQEVPQQEYTDEFLESSTYMYPTTRWEKGLGDEWRTSFLDSSYGVRNTLSKALCTMVNEDLRGMGRPEIHAIQLAVLTLPVNPHQSEVRFDREREKKWTHEFTCDLGGDGAGSLADKSILGDDAHEL